MNSKPYLSAIILTKNEEQNIINCLENIRWVDELIIVDDYSTDKTLELIKTASLKRKIKIYQKELEGNFAGQRNYALSKVSTAWTFFVDADEIVTSGLRNEILEKIKKNGDINGYSMKREDFIFGNKIRYGEFGNTKLLRLAKTGMGKWHGNVHEEWRIEGKISELENSLIHYPHQSINEFLKEINFYTDIRAKELFDNGIKSNFMSIILYTKLKFIQNYFIKFGFLDVTTGLVLALLMSLHSFLVRGKLWLLWQRK